MTRYVMITGAFVGLVMAGTVAVAQGRGPAPNFTQLDRDGDGAISLPEMQMRGRADFATLDRDADGGLSADELLADTVAQATERAQRMIARFDADGDGLLQEAEMPDPEQRRAARMFDRLDTDSSGDLSPAEFDAAQDRHRDRKGPRSADRG